MKKLNLLVLLLPIILLSCGGSGSDPTPALPNSSFTATVTGDITSSFDGEAEFVHSIVKSQPAGQNGSLITIGLENKNNSGENIVLGVFDLDNTSGIKEGTYNYVFLGTDLILSATYSNDNPDAANFIPVDGTTNQITITSVTDTRVKGSYEFTLADVLGGLVTIKGTFDALGVTTTN